MIENMIRQKLSRSLTGKHRLALENKTPSAETLSHKFQNIDELGLYLHIPFCEQICPYCPYNKEIYQPDMARRYAAAINKEIDGYAAIIGSKPVTSFYIGGGTPTTMLHTGIENIIDHIYAKLNMQCDIHMESHLNHLTSENMAAIKAMGVTNLSVGVEALQDRHLKTLGRPYTAAKALETVERIVRNGFECVNVDLMFALPHQTLDEIEQAGRTLAGLGVNQVAAYPLFRFPYTKMGSGGSESSFNVIALLKRRKMLRILENIFYSAGFERSSVWAFTQTGIPKYCSVTVPLYIGLGASGGSYLKDIFYLNTFSAAEYIAAIEKNEPAIALSMDLTPKMQMAGWLYWRIYETKFTKTAFKNRFEANFDDVYGTYLKHLARIGFLSDDGDTVTLSDRGSYWLHAFEDVFSINYISTLWGTSKVEAWPKRVVLSA